MPCYFSFEGRLPRTQPWCLIIENEVISFIPNRPGPNHKDFHKERLHELLFGDVDLLMDI